jgi:OmpA-OmpF porin, OOP family
MKNKVLYTLIICALSLQVAEAQTKQKPWGLGIAPSTYSFYALRDGSNFLKGEDYGAGVAVSLYRYVSPSFDMGLVTGFGRVRHPSDTSAVRADQRDNFFHGQFSIKYKLNNGHILPAKSIVSPYLATGFGANTYKDFKDWSMHVPIAVGVQVQIPKTQISVMGQIGFNVGILGESFLHHSVGLVVNFGQAKKKKGKTTTKPDEDPNANPTADNNNNTDAADNDYDGIPNEIDRCPNIYGSSLTFGCPDADGDGVPDSEDRCIDEKGYANLLGCGDRDNDGVIDPDDQCPDVYGVAPTGCPAADENDLDGDGVPNDQDDCPDTKGLFTAKGCPDADGDGIRDDQDICPDFFGVAEHNGCPLPKEEMDRMKSIYNSQVLAQKYNITDDRNPYNPKNKDFDPTDPYNPYNPTNPSFNVTDPNNPYNPDNPLFDINDMNNPYNEMSKNYNPKYAKIKPYDPNKNPADLDPKDPANFGRIVIGKPASDKYGGFNNNRGKPSKGNKGNKGNNNKGNNNNSNPSLYDPNFTYFDTNPAKLTGFEEKPVLTKEEEEYCNRLDLDQLKAAIYFETSVSSAQPNSLRSLDKIVDAMRKCALLEIQIAGHADADGPESTNQSLSEKRAQAVLKYITGQGISDKRLKYNAYGEQYPVAPNDNATNKQQNRRAEIKVQKTF